MLLYATDAVSYVAGTGNRVQHPSLMMTITDSCVIGWTRRDDRRMSEGVYVCCMHYKVRTLQLS